MRHVLILAAATLALAACGPRASDTAFGENVSKAEGETAVARNETAMGANSVQGPGADAVKYGDASLTVTSAEFASQAAISDMFEVMSSKLAVMSATDAKIKAFGRDMVDGHTKTTRELVAAVAADKADFTPPRSLDAEHQSLVDALRAKQGREFDALYKQQQIQSHTKTLALMQSCANGCETPAVKAFAAKTAPMVAMHLRAAQALP